MKLLKCEDCGEELVARTFVIGNGAMYQCFSCGSAFIQENYNDIKKATQEADGWYLEAPEDYKFVVEEKRSHGVIKLGEN